MHYRWIIQLYCRIYAQDKAINQSASEILSPPKLHTTRQSNCREWRHNARASSDAEKRWEETKRCRPTHIPQRRSMATTQSLPELRGRCCLPLLCVPYRSQIEVESLGQTEASEDNFQGTASPIEQRAAMQKIISKHIFLEYKPCAH